MERVAALGGNRKIKAACIFVSFSQSLNQNPNWLSKYSFQKQPFLKFRNFHRKTHLLVSHFNDMAGLHACIFIKKRLEHRCFPVNTVKYLRTTFFTEHLWWLLLSFIKRFLIWSQNVSNWNKIFELIKWILAKLCSLWLKVHFVLPILFVLTLASYRAVLYKNVLLSILLLSTKKQCWYSSILKRVCIFQKICFKVKVLKTFKISSVCHIKTCRSLKRRAILKIPIMLFLLTLTWRF